MFGAISLVAGELEVGNLADGAGALAVDARLSHGDFVVVHHEVSPDEDEEAVEGETVRLHLRLVLVEGVDPAAHAPVEHLLLELVVQVGKAMDGVTAEFEEAVDHIFSEQKRSEGTLFDTGLWNREQMGIGIVEAQIFERD